MILPGVMENNRIAINSKISSFNFENLRINFSESEKKIDFDPDPTKKVMILPGFEPGIFGL